MVKLKVLSFIIGKVKTSKNLSKVQDRPTKKQTKKENAVSFSKLVQNVETNKYVVHKVNTFYYNVKFEKFYLALIRGRLAINS